MMADRHRESRFGRAKIGLMARPLARSFADSPPIMMLMIDMYEDPGVRARNEREGKKLVEASIRVSEKCPEAK